MLCVFWRAGAQSLGLRAQHRGRPSMLAHALPAAAPLDCSTRARTLSKRASRPSTSANSQAQALRPVAVIVQRRHVQLWRNRTLARASPLQRTASFPAALPKRWQRWRPVRRPAAAAFRAHPTPWARSIVARRLRVRLRPSLLRGSCLLNSPRPAAVCAPLLFLWLTCGEEFLRQNRTVLRTHGLHQP